MSRRATDRLVVAAALTVIGALVAILLGLPEAAVLAAPWMVLLVLGLSNARRANVVTSIDVAEDRVVIGDEIEIIIAVTGSAGSAHVDCSPSDGFSAQGMLETDVADACVADVLTGNRAELRCILPAMTWGSHDFGRAHVQVTEPYGLFQWWGVVADPARVRVHPTPTQLRDLLTPWLVRRVSGAHPTAALGRGVEYADTRVFGPGDSLRDINWRASARSQELFVSQRHPDRATDVILLVDSFVESGHDVQKVVGLAIEAAVALAESHLSATDRVGLVELGGILRWVAPGTGTLQLQRLTDALLTTRLYANATERDLAVIPPRIMPPRSFVVALTPLLDPRFINALFLLAGRGQDVAVIECDSAWTADDADHMSDVSQFATRLWEAERDVVRDQLADNGVAVAAWREGEHLDLVINDLARRRRGTARVVRR